MGVDGAGQAPSPASRPRMVVVSAIGTAQIVAWGSSYYLTAVLAGPVAADTGWPLSWIVGGLSLGLLVSGLVSPWVGRLIDAHSGRPALAASAVLLAAALLTLRLAPTLAVFVAGWLVMGLGMGAGLYDPAFSTLGRLYGDAARGAITQITLFGGFASTVCWPLSAFLLYAVYPVPSGNWMVDAMPTRPGAFEQRRPLPAAWAGQRDAELAMACGVPDAVFVHLGRFVGAARSCEGALAMARRAVATEADTSGGQGRVEATRGEAGGPAL